MPRRRQRASRFSLVVVTALVGVLAAGSFWLDQRGELVTASVVAMQERILVRYQPMGDWDRYHEVTAAFDLPGGGSSIATVRVSAERYASLRAGDSIEVRYVPQFPLLARVGDRSTAGVMRDTALVFAGIPIVGWIAAGFLGLWVAARLGGVPVLAAGAAWGAAGWVLFFTPPQRDRPRPAQALAEVQRITLVNRAPRRAHYVRRSRVQFERRLEIPYQVVELHVPNENGDTVLAVDAVDSGSVMGLAVGARMPAWLDPTAPRDAQLTGGTRRFPEANRYHFFAPLSGFVILGTLAALGHAWRRSRWMADQPHTRRRVGQAIPQEGGA